MSGFVEFGEGLAPAPRKRPHGAVRRPAWWFRMRALRRWWSDTTEARGDAVNAALFLALVAAVCYRLLVIGAAA